MANQEQIDKNSIIDELNGNVDELSTTEELEMITSDLESKTSDMQKDISGLEFDNRRLKEDVEYLKDKFTKLKEEMVDSSVENSEVRSMLMDDIRCEIENFNKDFAKQVKNYVKNKIFLPLQKQIVELQKDNDRLKKQLNEVNDKPVVIDKPTEINDKPVVNDKLIEVNDKPVEIKSKQTKSKKIAAKPKIVKPKTKTQTTDN